MPSLACPNPSCWKRRSETLRNYQPGLSRPQSSEFLGGSTPAKDIAAIPALKAHGSPSLSLTPFLLKPATPCCLPCSYAMTAMLALAALNVLAAWRAGQSPGTRPLCACAAPVPWARASKGQGKRYLS